MIYFVQIKGGGPIKIGYTAKEPQLRFIKMRSDCPYPMELLGAIPGEVKEEQAFHEYLADHLLQGEWFSPTRAVLDFVEKQLARADCWKNPVIGRNWVVKHDHPLERYRVENKLKLSDLAERFGCGMPHLSQIISGKRVPSLALAIKISEETRIPAEQFARGAG